VALVSPSAPPAGALAESIPPSADKLLVEIGVLADLKRTGFQRNGGNTIWWAGAEARTETFDEGRSGFHVDRAGLEGVMGSVARRAGVRVHVATARVPEESATGWAVRCDTDGGLNVELRAPWVLDATGRRGLIATTEGRQPDRSTTTLALVRRWRRTGGFPAEDPTHTLIESYADGWAWSVPLGPEVRCLTAMVDHRHSALEGSSLDAALDAELDKAPHIGSVRVGSEPVGPAWACPASLYSAARFGRPGVLLVGDAGSFIDPLSSFGVKKALSSGWLAAVIVHTALVDPAMTGLAVQFFDDRERDVYRMYRARSADFFEQCARAYGHEYWTSRAAAAHLAGGDSAAGAEPDGPDEAEEARAALERIRARPSLDAVRGPTVRTVSRAAVVGHRIELVDHLASDRAPRGLRFVRNVDLGRVVDVAPRHAEVPDGWAAYNEGAPAVPLPDYLAALATAFAAGLLEHSGDTAADTRPRKTPR
jgi:flavin-dependent dehydrogenase